jgi:SulP family sulfate permease
MAPSAASLAAPVFVPKLFTTLKTYDRRQFGADLLAGLIVGVVAVPLALAFAIASGVSPDRGLYTAAVAGFLISVLGGSRVQIGGPTGAFVVVVYGIVAKFGLGGLGMCMLMAGTILVLMGLSGLGAAVKFVPYPVVTGFTSGIAVIIFSSQVKDLFGLSMGAVPADFIAKLGAFASAAGTVSLPTLGLSVFTLALLWLWPRVSRRVPAPIVALVAGTLAAALMPWPVETIGSRFGDLPRGLPALSWPDWPWSRVGELIQPATTVALLAAIESLLSAVVADGMIGGRHRAGMELVAQGVANGASALFGGIPATGAIARTATNIKSGGRTPVAGIVHAVVLLLVLMFLGKAVAVVPLAVLAAILVRVSYQMSEWRSFRTLLRSPRSDVLVLLTTFALTVLVDLTAAVEVGMVMAAFLFMRRMADLTEVESVTAELRDPVNGDSERDVAPTDLPAGVEVYEIRGPFFFGAADKLGSVLEEIENPPKVFILRMRHVPTLDASGLHALDLFRARCRRLGTELVLSEMRPHLRRVLEKTGTVERFGPDRVKNDFPGALTAAKAVMAKGGRA